MAGDVIDQFEVQTNGARFHVEVGAYGVCVTFRPGEMYAEPIEQFTGALDEASDDLVLVAHRRDPAADADLVEYVQAAIRERAPSWGPRTLWRDYDWREVMKYARTNCAGVAALTGDTSGFEIRDVAEVIARVDGENDGANWCGVFRLRDGRFAFVEAGCDYTGWG